MACAAVTLYEMPDESYTDHFTSQDRKLLIELAVKMDLTRTDVKDMQTSGSTRYAELRTELVGTYQQLELRVRTLENFRWWLVGAVAIVAPILSALTSWAVSAHR